MRYRVELQRQAYTEFGTLGRWSLIDGDQVIFSCLSAENPDRGNRPGESCIPEGDYSLVRARYNRGGGGYDAFQILLPDGSEIPGRTYVKVHIGNSDHDVEGCVVLGNGPIVHRGHWGVGPSGRDHGAFVAFRAKMDELEIAACPLTIFYRKG